MRDTAVNKAILDIKLDRLEKDDNLVMTTVRPGSHLSSLLDVFLKITKKSPSALLTNEISKELSELIIKKKIYAKAIEKSCQRLLDEDGFINLKANDDCLSILSKQDILKVNSNYHFDLDIKEEKK